MLCEKKIHFFLMFLPVDMSYIKKIERKDILYVSNTNVFFFTKSEEECNLKLIFLRNVQIS